MDPLFTSPTAMRPLLTPPPTKRKAAKFMEPANKLTYYKDLYGKQNEDEVFDRFVDVCEEESDSGVTTENGEEEGFLARSRVSKAKLALKRKENESFGTMKQGRVELDHVTSPALPVTKSEAAKFTYQSTSLTGSGIFDFLQHRPASPNGKRYMIAPSLNAKHSLPVRGKSTKLTPKKGGIFAKSLATMDDEMGTPNSAGEAMDDLDIDRWRAGAREALEFADPYPLEMMEAPTSPRIDPQLLLEDLAREDGEGEDGGAVFGSKQVEGDGGAGAGEEGDVEDNASDTGAKVTAFRGRPKKKATASLSKIKTSGEAPKPGPAVANTKTKLQKSSPAFALRHPSRISKIQPTARSGTSTKGRAKATQLQAKNRKVMTARAAALRNKTKPKKLVTTRTLRGAAGGRSIRLRNWKGEVINQDGGIVVIYEDETDAEKYARYELP